uniref:Signal recognition particle subunit SRP68 n=1 Tax=Syphacia muris TaxID=451379 RepID=A0A0N5AZC2_9BILA
MAVATQKDDVVLTSFATLSILQLIKDAQQRHGLRHGDYQRYRGYCSRRIRRIRKSLGYTHLHKSVPKHPAKFSQKKIVLDVVTEERYLEIAIFDAERNWSYAMQLKHEAGEDAQSRKRFHMIAKLRKAVQHTMNLDSIVRQCSRTDAATKLESQAYHAWMTGCLLFEQKDYKKALDFLKTAKTIYQKLLSVVKETNRVNLYNSRCQEIQPQIRFCEFSSGESKNTDEAVSEMINMRLKIGEEESSLQDDFDKLIAEMRAKVVVDQDVAISWAGKSIPVGNEAVRQVIKAADQFSAQIQSTTSHEDKLSLYEQFLSGVRDTITKITDEYKKGGSDITSLNNRCTLAYLDFLRLSKTVERYILIINYARSQSEKKSKPQDMVRLYDSAIENCSEILELPDIGEDNFLKDAYAFKKDYYLAFRCFYMAEACAGLSKFAEASALFKRATDRTNNVLSSFSNLEANSLISENKEDLLKLLEKISVAKYTAQTNHLTEAAKVEETANAGLVDSRPLIDTLDENRNIKPSDLQNPESPICIVPLPPNFIPMPNKPIFFDLALNHVKMPDLEGKIASFPDKVSSNQSDDKKTKEATAKTNEAAEQQGIGGMVKGWFWGKK